jgi:hypothetical protein
MSLKDGLELLISTISLLISLFVLRWKGLQSERLANLQLELDEKLASYKGEVDKENKKELATFSLEQQKELTEFKAHVQSLYETELEKLRKELGFEQDAGLKLYEKRLEILPDLLRSLRSIPHYVKGLQAHLENGWAIRASLYQATLECLKENVLLIIYISLHMPAGIEEFEPNHEFTFDAEDVKIMLEVIQDGLMAIQDVEKYFSRLLQLEEQL